MIIVRDDLWLCTDCTHYACNGYIELDLPDPEDEKTRERAIVRGVDGLGPHLVPDFGDEAGEGDGHDEFSRCSCDACGTRLAGERHRFVVLGEGEYEVRSLASGEGS